MVGSAENVPYATIAGEIRQGHVIPFVGAAASFAGVAEGPHRLPDADGLVHLLLKDRWTDYPGEPSDPLTKVSQFLDEILLGRQRVYEVLEEIFHSNDVSRPVSPTAQLLAEIPGLRLVISTNYDDQLERALASAKPPRPYVVVTHVTNPMHPRYPRLAVCSSDEPDRLHYLTDKAFLLSDHTDALIIYKMHGTFGTGLSYEHDTLVLTENDYVHRLTMSYTTKIPPSALVGEMKRKHLLFLGYSLRDWNFRVVLQQLREAGIGIRSWAVQHSVSVLEKKFWEKRDVNIYDVDLTVFVDRMREALGFAAVA